MPNPFNIEFVGQEDCGILRLDGYLDAHTAPQFEAAIQSQLEAGRYKLIVDGGRLNYISSAGLGVFMGFIEEVREKGGDIKICSLIPKVHQVFEILGFPALYDILDSEQTALERFRNCPAGPGAEVQP